MENKFIPGHLAVLDQKEIVTVAEDQLGMNIMVVIQTARADHPAQRADLF